MAGLAIIRETGMPNLLTFRQPLILSLVCAIASLSARWLIPNPPLFAPVSLLLAVAWLILLISALRRYGRIGYWALLGAPLALFWPIMLAWGIYGCFFGNANCDS